MKKGFRSVLVSGLAGLLLAGFSANLLADAEQEAIKAECTAQGQENGLEGAELKQFIQECVGGSGEQQGAQPQQ